MSRAHRYSMPGHLWHITHLCHERGFFLKFAKDRKRWRYWLFKARRAAAGVCQISLSPQITFI
jgi:putative transposase